MLIVCAVSLQKYASALASPVRSGLIVWGIIRIAKVSAVSKTAQKPQKQKKSNAVPHIISINSFPQQLTWRYCSADFVRLNERKGSDYIKHFGDITQLDGHELPVVDCIIGGSPCQDLSVAGKRAGLAGERSGLFMEQMRVVKEMREQDVQTTGQSGFLVRPRYMVWENVPGALSSGKPKGADFQAVLEEIVKIVCKEAPVVPIPKEGWPKAGCISGVGDSGCTFSIAWRLHDAQFWGVPQRRKRIALVADFGGLSAPEILFERTGLRWDSEQSAEEGQGAAAGTERSP